MTFLEYIHQEEAQRQPIGSVLVTEQDCHSVMREKGKVVSIKLHIRKGYFDYVVDENGLCWAPDAFGNKMRRSCFKYIE